MKAVTLLLLLTLSTGLASVASAAETEGEHGGDGLLQTAFKWINLGLLIGALVYLAGPKIRQAFAGMRQQIRSEIEEARQEWQRSQQQLADTEERWAGLEAEVAALRQEAERQAAAEVERIRTTAQREADRILSTTRAEIDSSLRAARLELRAYTARLAVSLAEPRIRQQLTPEAHAALFRGFVRNLPAPGDERRR